jgi:hypothetical protein
MVDYPHKAHSYWQQQLAPNFLVNFVRGWKYWDVAKASSILAFGDLIAKEIAASSFFSKR